MVATCPLDLLEAGHRLLLAEMEEPTVLQCHPKTSTARARNAATLLEAPRPAVHHLIRPKVATTAALVERTALTVPAHLRLATHPLLNATRVERPALLSALSLRSPWLSSSRPLPSHSNSIMDDNYRHSKQVGQSELLITVPSH